MRAERLRSDEPDRAVEPEPPRAPAARGEPERLLATVGLLLPLTALAVLVAALVQASTSLPADYTWLRPLRIIKDVALRDSVPSLVLGVACLGLASRSSLRAWPKRWREILQPDAIDRGRAARCALALIGLYGLALALSNRYHLGDWLALAPLAILLGWPEPDRAAIVRGAAELVCVVVVFVFCSYAFTVFKAALFLGQDPLDEGLIAFESALFGQPVHRFLYTWAKPHPDLVIALDRVYYRFFDHMTAASVFLIAAGRRRERTEYLSALALCYLIGGFAYHLVPAMGPVYHELEHFGGLRQLPLISNHFQVRLADYTAAVQSGTLYRLESYEFIACMPSLHLAHEMVMLHYARASRAFFALSLVFMVLTMLAVMVLGWHYLSDLFGSVALAALAIVIATKARGWLLPQVAMPAAR